VVLRYSVKQAVLDQPSECFAKWTTGWGTTVQRGCWWFFHLCLCCRDVFKIIQGSI